MTGEVFIKWLLDINDEMKLSKRKILLLIDNCPAHNINNQYSNIEIMFFPKNTTGILQPMDREIICNFKLFFNRYKLSNVLDQVEKGGSVYDIYKKITFRDTIIYSELTYNDVSQTTINNCFKHLSF
ncbi:Tigger transposable element-derived protein 6 [Cucumispora dikerogammari]|nr:Tigger transposable element-derived protein 6 [Cucumispora dikerogammari]